MVPLWIIGGGGHAKVVIECARTTGHYHVAGILDDRFSSTVDVSIAGIPLLGKIDVATCHALAIDRAVIAIGNAQTQRRIRSMLGDAISWETIAHAFSSVASSAAVGNGAVICAGAIVQPDAVIGNHVILNTACSVDHDCLLHDMVQIGPGAHLGGHVTVGTGAFVGIGASVMPGLEIGEWATVGAGAVVTRNVAPYSTVVGVPARVIATQGGEGRRS